jgi:2-haloacid dehalogenase
MIKAVVFDAYGTLFDVQSVADATERAYPGYGEYITQIWRQKQLEYSWLRSLMGRYQDFWSVTQEALAYTLNTLGREPDPTFLSEMADAYNRLLPYPDAAQCLKDLAPLRLAILSNGAPAMLDAVARDAGILDYFEAVVSAHDVRIFKPSPKVYRHLLERLNVRTDAVGFVSSNAWDVAGAASAGLTSFWIQRHESEPPDALGFGATRVVRTLGELVDDPRVGGVAR